MGRPRKALSPELSLQEVVSEQGSPQHEHMLKLREQEQAHKKTLKVLKEEYRMVPGRECGKIVKVFWKSNGNKYQTFVCNTRSKDPDKNAAIKALIDNLKAEGKLPKDLAY